MRMRDRRLPRLEHDRSLMLAARSVLRERRGPDVRGSAEDDAPTGAVVGADRRRRCEGMDRCLDLIDQQWIRAVAEEANICSLSVRTFLGDPDVTPRSLLNGTIALPGAVAKLD